MFPEKTEGSGMFSLEKTKQKSFLEELKCSEEAVAHVLSAARRSVNSL